MRRDDLVRVNHWLSVTRLQCSAGILAVATVVAWLEPHALSFSGITSVCATNLVLSLAYEAWLRRGHHLRLLAWTQLSVDTFAVFIGLQFVRDVTLPFHFVFLLPIVAASMVEWQCGACIVALASVAHFWLLARAGDTAWLTVTGIVPPTIFIMTTLQALFYARHLAAKNAELATAAESLDASNRRLGDEASVSTALLHVTQALTTSLDPREILEHLTDAVRRALLCDWSVALLRDEQRDVYRVVAASGARPDVFEQFRDIEFPAGGLPLFTAVAEDGVAVVEDRHSPLLAESVMAQWNIASLFCTDLRRVGASAGFLAAAFRERTGPFSVREIRLLRSIAQQAVIALENARLVDSLRAASRLKSEFIGTMSHELRSPLNVIIGYADLLLDGEMGPLADEQRNALERVHTQALQLLDLIKETLDVNRLEAGRLPLDAERFTLGALIDDLRGSIPAEWLKPGVVLNWRVDAPTTVICSDRAKLKKVLRNLIQNALKFTDRGNVTTSVTNTNGCIELCVADTGIGIAAADVPIIFEMFRQVDGSTTRRHGGVGLGLYIVKQLVRALNGEISVSSTPGAGSVFRVRIHSNGSAEHAGGTLPAATLLHTPPAQ